MLCLLTGLAFGATSPLLAQSGGKPTRPTGDQKPGNPAGNNYDPSSGCIIYYAWTNLQPNGQLGPSGYRRRVDDGKGYICPTSLGWQ
jgi:hypothetical protein